MRKIRQAILVAVLLVLLLVGISFYYFSTLTSNKQVSVNVQKGDFLLQVSLNKTEYRQDEQITVNFNLTYLGRPPADIYTIASCPYMIKIKNAAKTNTTESTDIIPGDIDSISPHHFVHGQSLLATAVMSGRTINCYTNDVYFPWGGGASFSGFSPDNTYYIQPIVKVYTNTTARRFNPGIELATSTIQIKITK